MEKTVKITWEGKEVNVVLTDKDITWGKYKEISQKSVIIKEHEGQPMQFRNTDLMEDLVILEGIKTAPFDLTLENLNKLTIDDRNKIANAKVN